MAIHFWKMSGAGNDFIAVDNRQDVFPGDEKKRRELIVRICRRRLGIGADGVLLVEPPIEAGSHFRMRYYNSDGGEAETCGNGARCIARFAHELGIAPASMRFDTSAGPYIATVSPESVTVSMGDAFDLKMDVELGIEGLPDGKVDFVNSGVPHSVAIFDNVENLQIIPLGPTVRWHESFAPAGTNMNFVGATNKENHFLIRTYERGVEEETLACGTGCIAAGVILERKKLAAPPVTFTVASGVDLTVHFTPTDDGATDVQLEGEARPVCRGEFD